MTERPEPAQALHADSTADRHLAGCADQEERCDGRGDLGNRPAMRRSHGLKICAPSRNGRDSTTTKQAATTRMRYLPIDRAHIGVNRESSKTADCAVMISRDSFTFNLAANELTTGGEEQHDERSASHRWL
jgi:hypothetical protein